MVDKVFLKSRLSLFLYYLCGTNRDTIFVAVKVRWKN